MPNLLSGHWIPTHGRPEDIQYFAALNSAVLKTVDADAHRVAQLYERCGRVPRYILRDWALSEQKDDMRKNPVQTGVRHAKERIAAAVNYPVPKERVLLCGINEPEVWVDLSCVPYTVAFLDELTKQGYKGCALNLSVGWPANNGENTPPNWRPYEPVLGAIMRGGHFLCLHEYWDNRGPDYNWGWWAGRFEKCPWNVPIIIGECGIDQYVSDGSVAPEKRGWQGQVKAGVYATQVKGYLTRVSHDKRVVGCCLYTTDYSHPWASFDTGPAYRELVQVYVEAGTGVALPGQPPTEPPPTQPPTQPPPTQPPTTAKVTHPVPGAPVTQNFYQNPQNYARFNLPGHNGTDYGVPEGTAVQCIADGIVMYSSVDADYGNYVRVFHPRLHAHSFYAHLSSASVTAGAVVEVGSVIAKSGNTGNSTGPHLHLEIRLGEAESYARNTPMPKGRVDPRSWLAWNGVSDS